ncbi:energy transducer TonB [Coralloluteibacterium thermophilus]|uniref:Protein TonB n=1 Tax=Coralloluteibacterium thermophilum TaxID=2707049 RepID=A0ABV9NLI1_9GAMM
MSGIDRRRVAAAAAMAAMLLAGCEQQPAQAPNAPVAQAPDAAPLPERAAPAPAAQVEQADEPLLERARRARAEQRLYAPAGDNAVEHYLALRAESPEEARFDAALQDLFPYVLIATEQAVVREDLAEAQRLAALLARIDAQARALPRIGEAIAENGAELRERERERQLAAAARAAAPSPSPAAAAPAPPPAPAPQPVVAAAPSVEDAPVRPEPTPAPAPPPAPVAAAPAPAPVAAPVLLHRVEPRYPAVARARRIEGRVELAYVVRGDGTVDEVEVLSAHPEGIFEREAIGSVRRWRYSATGVDTPMRGRVEFLLDTSS